MSVDVLMPISGNMLHDRFESLVIRPPMGVKSKQVRRSFSACSSIGCLLGLRFDCVLHRLTVSRPPWLSSILHSAAHRLVHVQLGAGRHAEVLSTELKRSGFSSSLQASLAKRGRKRVAEVEHDSVPGIFSWHERQEAPVEDPQCTKRPCTFTQQCPIQRDAWLRGVMQKWRIQLTRLQPKCVFDGVVMDIAVSAHTG